MDTPSGPSALQRVGEFDTLCVRQPGEGLADVERRAVAVIGAVVLLAETRCRRFILPLSNPLASGKRTMIATFFAFAVGKTSVAGFWRKRLKMICNELRPSCSKQTRASASVSTLAPNARIFPLVS